MRISILMLLVIFLLGSPAHSEEVLGIFLPEPSVNKLLTDRRMAEVTAEKLDECDKGAKELQRQITLEVKNSDIYKQNWQTCETTSREKDAALKNMEKLAEDSQKMLEEERKGKPSRLTWFGVGFGSALLTIIGIWAAAQ